MAMAKIIEFYIPSSFRKNIKWVPADQRGKLIQFPAYQEIDLRRVPFESSPEGAA